MSQYSSIDLVSGGTQAVQPKLEAMEAAWYRLHSISGAATPDQVIAYWEGVLTPPCWSSVFVHDASGCNNNFMSMCCGQWQHRHVAPANTVKIKLCSALHPDKSVAQHSHTRTAIVKQQQHQLLASMLKSSAYTDLLLNDGYQGI